MSHKDWLQAVVSGVPKLQLLASSSINDLERWEVELFKVLNAEEVAQFVDEEKSSLCPDAWYDDVSPSPWPIGLRRGIALALLLSTIHTPVLDKMYHAIVYEDSEDPKVIYSSIRSNYVDWIKEVKADELARTKWEETKAHELAAMRLTIKAKEEELRAWKRHEALLMAEEFMF